MIEEKINQELLGNLKELESRKPVEFDGFRYFGEFAERFDEKKYNNIKDIRTLLKIVNGKTYFYDFQDNQKTIYTRKIFTMIENNSYTKEEVLELSNNLLEFALRKQTIRNNDFLYRILLKCKESIDTFKNVEFTKVVYVLKGSEVCINQFVEEINSEGVAEKISNLKEVIKSIISKMYLDKENLKLIGIAAKFMFEPNRILVRKEEQTVNILKAKDFKAETKCKFANFKLLKQIFSKENVNFEKIKTTFDLNELEVLYLQNNYSILDNNNAKERIGDNLKNLLKTVEENKVINKDILNLSEYNKRLDFWRELNSYGKDWSGKITTKNKSVLEAIFGDNISVLNLSEFIYFVKEFYNDNPENKKKYEKDVNRNFKSLMSKNLDTFGKAEDIIEFIDLYKKQYNVTDDFELLISHECSSIEYLNVSLFDTRINEENSKEILKKLYNGGVSSFFIVYHNIKDESNLKYITIPCDRNDFENFKLIGIDTENRSNEDMLDDFYTLYIPHYLKYIRRMNIDKYVESMATIITLDNCDKYLNISKDEVIEIKNNLLKNHAKDIPKETLLDICAKYLNKTEQNKIAVSEFISGLNFEFKYGLHNLIKYFFKNIKLIEGNIELQKKCLKWFLNKSKTVNSILSEQTKLYFLIDKFFEDTELKEELKEKISQKLKEISI